MERNKKVINQTKQSQVTTFQDNNEGISTAFRKLLRRVSTQATMSTPKKSIPRFSFSSFHKEQLLKKRKASVSLFQNKKSQPQIRSNQTQMTYLQKSNETNSKTFNEPPYKSVRCHSNPSSSNSIHIQTTNHDYHRFLIAKTYNFEEAFSNKTPKTNKRNCFFIRSPLNAPCLYQENECYQSKIKLRQKRKLFNNIPKTKKQLSKFNRTSNEGQVQPWESDKIEQFVFMNQ